MSIQFRFHPQKTIEAAAFLLKLHQKPMKYLGLLKMLYLADRMALEEIEWPITGDRYYSMDYGSVLSSVLDLINGKPVENALPLWLEFIATPELLFQDSGYYVELIKDPGTKKLCEAEEEILQKIYQEFGHLNPFKVAEWTHDLPEWQDPHGSRIPIEIEDILKKLGKSNLEIEEIREEAIQEAYLDEVLND
ncbi:MAG: SocA family protein [Cyanobacteria bacterium SBLK]|nr:SocA family protein [Cyanobacteria bacterium SBLK]